MKLSQVASKKKDYPKAKTYLQQAEKHLDELHMISPQNVSYKQNLDNVRKILTILKDRGF